MNKYFRISLTILFIALIISNEIKSQIIDSTQKWIKVTGGLNFPEGPAYDGKSSIYLSNCSGGWIAKSNSVLVDTFVSKNDDSLLIEKQMVQLLAKMVSYTFANMVKEEY